MHISDLSIKRPVFMLMVLLTLLLFGMVSFQKMGVDLYPKIDFPVITVLSALPGADPEVVESTVTDPIEESLSSISSIKSLRSKSFEGISQVIIEFEFGKNVDVAYQEVQAKIGAIRNKLPSDLRSPLVEKFDLDSAPILSILASGSLPIDKLTHLIDKEVKNSLQRIPQVGQVKMVGGRERHLWIWLDRDLLDAHGVTVHDIEQSLKVHHVEFAGGRLEKGASEIPLRTKAEFQSAKELSQWIVAYRHGAPVRIQDLGKIEEGLEERRASSFLNGISAIALQVQRQSGSNTVEVAKAVKQEVLRQQSVLEKKGIKLQIAQDNSEYIERSVQGVFHHLYFGGACALLILLLFLRSGKSTLICALSLPAAVIGTFAFMAFFGFTQNVMSLLGLSLAIGLLIDDAIVVQENIMRHIEREPLPHKASSKGAKEISLAVVATSLSVVAVFVPVAFMKGIIGNFFYQFGLTVTFAVLISLLVSFTLNPLLSSRFLKASKHGAFYHFFETIFCSLEKRYGLFLRWALGHRKTVVFVAVGSLVAALYLAHFLRFEFMTREDQSEFSIRLQTPKNSSLAYTEEGMKAIRAKVQQAPWVDYLFEAAGSDQFQDVSQASFYVKMKDKKDRAISQDQAMVWTREQFSSFPLGKIFVEPVFRISVGGRKACEIQLELRGPSLEKLLAAGEKVLAHMQKTPGYLDPEISYEEGKHEVEIQVQRELAADVGVSPAVIASTIKSAMGGNEIGKFKQEGDRYGISLRMQEEFRTDPEQIGLLKVRGNFGYLVPLRNLVEVHQVKGPEQIDHYNRMRQITLYANLDREHKVLGEAIADLSSTMEKMELPLGYSYGFVGSAQSFKESFATLFFALAMAVVLIYMVLAAQFESFLQPLIIMMALPLSLVGALGGLVLLHMTMTIFTMIGIILLMGLVTKNGILLVDRINTLKKEEGADRTEAIVRAGTLRLRPIIMTTSAVVFGMVPIAFSVSSGSESHSPMAVTVIGGLLTSTFLTLIVVPVIYTIVDDLQKKWKCKKV